MRKPRLLAVIPARGGSKGLPGKNIRAFVGLPLIAHSIRLAEMCPEITRCIISTDSEEIADVARRFGGDVPFIRPAELARSNTAMWPVLRHALAAVEKEEQEKYDFLLLLDPTSPTRIPEDVSRAFSTIRRKPEADGIVSVSEPHFSPIWHTVVDRDGWMTPLFPKATKITRRQDVPQVFRINGLLYIWTTDYIRQNEDWHDRRRHMMFVVPEIRATSFDTLEEFRMAELLVESGLITLPWLGKEKS